MRAARMKGMRRPGFSRLPDHKHHGQEGKGNAAQVVQDHLNDHIGVVGEDAPGACDNAAGAHVGAVGVAHHVLHQHNEGAQEGKDGGKHLGPLPGKQRGNQAEKSADAQGKAQKLRQHCRGDRAAHPQVEHQLQEAHRGHQKKPAQGAGVGLPEQHQGRQGIVFCLILGLLHPLTSILALRGPGIIRLWFVSCPCGTGTGR